MFSFFKSSKKSPVVSPVAEHKVHDNIQKNADDFVVIPQNQPSNIYPPVPPQNPSPHHPLHRQFSVYVNYTQNVPFKLNPALVSEGSDNDIWLYKIKNMNTDLNRINLTHYDFKLERSIVES